MRGVDITVRENGPVADVTVIIPHIPPRGWQLNRAVDSLGRQTLKPAEVFIMTDDQREGSAVMRNRALEHVTTKWVAFLDDDDELLPIHLASLVNYAQNDDYDVIYPGCRIFDKNGREIPRRMEWGRYLMPFDPDLLREMSYIPVTSLVRTELAKEAKFGALEGSVYDDWGFYVRLLDLGARFVHLPLITWSWHHHGNNTQGLATKW